VLHSPLDAAGGVQPVMVLTQRARGESSRRDLLLGAFV